MVTPSDKGCRTCPRTVRKDRVPEDVIQLPRGGWYHPKCIKPSIRAARPRCRPWAATFALVQCWLSPLTCPWSDIFHRPSIIAPYFGWNLYGFKPRWNPHQKTKSNQTSITLTLYIPLVSQILSNNALSTDIPIFFVASLLSPSMSQDPPFYCHCIHPFWTINQRSCLNIPLTSVNHQSMSQCSFNMFSVYTGMVQPRWYPH